MSIWRTSVSYAHTVKAMQPLFTVMVARVFFGDKQTWMIYLSLLPVVFGVMVASATELSFDLVGMLSALTGAIVMALQSVFNKRVMRARVLDHINLLYYSSMGSLLILVPMWVMTDLRHFLSEDHGGGAGADVGGGGGGAGSKLDVYEVADTTGPWGGRSDPTWLLSMLLLNGLANFGQQLVAFTCLSLVTPLSYAIASSTKRVVVILVSIVVFRNPITPANVFGMAVTTGGVLLYNKCKFDQAAAQAAKTLPVHVPAPKPMMMYASANGMRNEVRTV